MVKINWVRFCLILATSELILKSIQQLSENQNICFVFSKTVAVNATNSSQQLPALSLGQKVLDWQFGSNWELFGSGQPFCIWQQTSSVQFFNSFISSFPTAKLCSVL